MGEKEVAKLPSCQSRMFQEMIMRRGWYVVMGSCKLGVWSLKLDSTKLELEESCWCMDSLMELHTGRCQPSPLFQSVRHRPHCQMQTAPRSI